jgi:demethylmenaquinone methyltransferase/2-methoxy-6-polyprenyl-1,4-benzoquinol methylase
MRDTGNTDFGFKTVPETDKARRVNEVFDKVAARYDWMNDLASLGLHRYWKRAAVAQVAVPSKAKILDLAGGTGDLTRLFMTEYPDAAVVLSDINEPMLAAGRQKLRRLGLGPYPLLCDAEKLPFADETFDVVSIGFGIRNVTRKDDALAEMRRVLKPEGQAVILEFSHVPRWFSPFYWFYTLRVLPKIAKLLVDDEEGYRYLAESIKMHPNQETFADMMRTAGFKNVSYRNLNFGIVAVHVGTR